MWRFRHKTKGHIWPAHTNSHVISELTRWQESRPNCSPVLFCGISYTAFTVEKSCPIIVATSVIFTKTTQRNQSPNRRKFAQSGHPGRDASLSSRPWGKFPPGVHWMIFSTVQLKLLSCKKPGKMLVCTYLENCRQMRDCKYFFSKLYSKLPNIYVLFFSICQINTYVHRLPSNNAFDKRINLHNCHGGVAWWSSLPPTEQKISGSNPARV
jgi:hypothetical protein